MKNRLFCILLISILMLSGCSSDKKESIEPSTIEIVFDNPNPLNVDISSYKPVISGVVSSANALKSITAIQVNGTSEVTLEQVDLPDGTLEYEFNLSVVYQTSTNSVRIEALDDKGQKKAESLQVHVEQLPAVDPAPIDDKDAFPGAEGFGRYTTGGRGGKVFFVENLNDDSKPGCLRWAINQAGARTIVFRVSGTIELTSPLVISQNHLTIAGQSAPGDGICIAGNYMQIKDGLENVIIRYIRFRAAKGSGEYDAAWGRNCTDIVFDHCSFSWGNDEVASFYDNENFTMQWCIISESFYRSTHPKGDHGYGGIWGGMGASFHHNLIAHHTSRNPRFCGARYHEATRDKEIVDFRNNVIYNWGANSVYGGEMGQQNMVNNYYKSGPATQDSKKNRIVEITTVDSKWYIDGNYVEGYPAITADNWDGGVQGQSSNSIVKATIPFATGDIQTQTASEAYNDVLAQAGASLKRDVVDARIISEVTEGNALYGGAYGAGTGIIDSENDTEGFPMLETYDEIVDLDNDGMDDEWELKNGLDPKNPFDHKEFAIQNNYTNLEVFLNQIIQ